MPPRSMPQNKATYRVYTERPQVTSGKYVISGSQVGINPGQ